ncbi:PepSY-associated TM helix domain-containing protein [Hydrogenophaga sp.]|nr:PepSY-associated TM helix domain-containing protein [Hydrogenophaga sp.]MDO9434517.1 PepSY-associated TM helix domain-containing protein [Hydrogenophaga sp.]
MFCVSGLFLLKFHASSRHMVWPVEGAGLLIPLLLMILFTY